MAGRGREEQRNWVRQGRGGTEPRLQRHTLGTTAATTAALAEGGHGHVHLHDVEQDGLGAPVPAGIYNARNDDNRYEACRAGQMRAMRANE